MCYSCGGKATPSEIVPDTFPAVHEEGDTDEESSEEGDVCGVEWDCELNGAGDEDDDILRIRLESTAQSKLERPALVVDSAAAETFYQQTFAVM